MVVVGGEGGGEGRGSRLEGIGRKKGEGKDKEKGERELNPIIII